MAYPRFDESATTWKGAFLRAAAFSAPHFCGAFLISRLVSRPARDWVLGGLLLFVIPIGLAAFHRSWRVGVAWATITGLVLGLAFTLVGIITAVI